MRRLRRAFIVAGVGAAAVIACGPGFLDGISGGTRALAEAGTPDANATCAHAEAPARPAGDDPSDALALPVFAFDAIRIDTLTSGDAGAPPPQGLDLDQTCTCEGQNDSCVRPAGQKPFCDGPQGRDNGLAYLFNQLSEGIPLFPTAFATERIHAGGFTILMDLLGWNGKPDDPSVQVAFRQSGGIDTTADGGRPTPLFDGNDLWTVDPSGIAQGEGGIGKDCRESAFNCVALVRDANGYVAGNQVVARPRIGTGEGPVTLSFRTGAGYLTIPLYDFSVVANITGPTNGAYHLEGELVGRVAASDLVRGFGNLEDFTSSDPTQIICNNPTLFAGAKLAICNVRDVTTASDASTAPCDSISVAISFGAGPAIAGTVFQPSFAVQVCADAGLDCQ